MQSLQARAPGGRSQERPLFGSGRIHLEIGDGIRAICFDGSGVIRELINSFGVVHEIKHRLDLVKRHFPYRESDHILSVACNILCGRERHGDLNRLRSDVPYMEALGAKMIPSPNGGGRLHAALHRSGGDCADGGHQRRASLTPAGSGPGTAGSGGVSGHRWDRGSDAGTEEDRIGDVLPGGLGLLPADDLAGQHRQGMAGFHRDPIHSVMRPGTVTEREVWVRGLGTRASAQKELPHHESDTSDPGT